MEIVFSKHSLEQILERKISKNSVEEILKNPQAKILSEGLAIYQSLIVMDTKKYLCRVFVNEQKKPNLVVPVYITSKISKYHES
jgi:hypothetical protein